jgi:UDP-N-acetylmuramoyl-tripeptide--D-alanyl-D-alanine ligase
MFKLKDIIKATNANVTGAASGIDIKSISTDSRTLRRGALFVALKGKKFNSLDFIKDAVRKGASSVMVDKSQICLQQIGVPVLAVNDTEQALGLIAALYRKRFNIPIIAVVGSNGKTTTKNMLGHALSNRFNVLKTEENLNNKIGVAKTLLRLRKGHEIGIIESGTNSPGEIEYAGRIIKPDIVVTTNIGRSHLQGLSTKAGVLKEKIAMVECLEKRGVWIRNCDDKFLMKRNYKNIEIVDFGIANKAAKYRAEDIRHKGQGMEFRVGKDIFYIPLLGTHNVYNSLAAIAAASLFTDTDTIRKALFSFKAVSMRMQVQDCGRFKIINDAYNANPDSFRCAVSALREFKTAGKRIFVAADMLELGNQSERLHFLAGKFLARSRAADILAAFGQYAPALTRGAVSAGMKKTNVKAFKDKKDIIGFLKKTIKDGDTMLVKGSRGMKMEEIINCFITCSTR